MLPLFSLIALAAVPLLPDPTPRTDEQRVRQADARFWDAFNACARQPMADALAADVEFYHDKTGATITRDAVVASLMTGPCGTAGLHVRREAVADSLAYDPVPGFGAILSGRHRFLARREGEAERLDGEARFVIVWRIADGRASMYRILSFAHGPATVAAAPVAPVVPVAVLQRRVGHYATAQGDVTVTLTGGRLHLVSGGLSTDLVPITATVFQAADRPLRFTFTDQDGTPDRISVQEDGATVAQGPRQDAP